MTRALNPVDKSTERVTKILKEQSKGYDWSGVTFPTSLKQVKVFEKNNGLLVNVFKFDREKDCVSSMSISHGEYKGRALLISIDDRYAVVKSISRLLGSQASKGKERCKRFFCHNCLENFTREQDLKNHIVVMCELK